MWRGLELHRDVDASWQVEDFFSLHGSSQGAGGEEVGGKGTQVCRWVGRKSWEHTGVSGPGERLEQVWAAWTRLLHPNSLAGMPVDPSMCLAHRKSRLRTVEQVTPESRGWNRLRVWLPILCLYGQRALTPFWPVRSMNQSQLSIMPLLSPFHFFCCFLTSVLNSLSFGPSLIFLCISIVSTYFSVSVSSRFSSNPSSLTSLPDGHICFL